ncbi:MAG: UbiX family flavin prenyltransferase [SAR202 cluster bacterium]|nr:UbiX family flavin prenyltransferase [SAR202 cluster bacterium]
MLGGYLNNETTIEKPLVVGISGASGSIIASKLVDALIERDIQVALIVSHASRIVWKQEMDESFGEFLERKIQTGKVKNYHIGDIQAPMASGTYPIRGMVIVPCSMATVAALATGLADNLLRRTADVCFKERRPITIVPRETPLSQLHLENLSKLANMGANIMPPQPAFYLKPNSLDDVVEFLVQRLLMTCGITDELPQDIRYNGPN